MKWLGLLLIMAVVAVAGGVALLDRPGGSPGGESDATPTTRGQPEQGLVVERGDSWTVTGWGNENDACVRYSSHGRFRSESCGHVPNRTQTDPGTSAVLITTLLNPDQGIVAGGAVEGVHRVVIRVGTRSASAEIKPAPGTAGGFFAAQVPDRWFENPDWERTLRIDSYDRRGNLIEAFDPYPPGTTPPRSPRR